MTSRRPLQDFDRPLPAVLSRRELLALGAAGALWPGAGWSQAYPSKPVRIMVGTAPGASIDGAARIAARKLSEYLGGSVVVENKPGGAGVICTEYVVRSPADGHTLLLGTPSPILVAPQAMASVKFNVLTELEPINMISTSPIGIAINPSLPARNMQELVALSRKRPIRMGLPLVGSVSHLVVEMTAKSTGCEFQNIPYNGGAPAMNDAIAGHVDATVSDIGVLIPMHKAGRLRLVMVTSEKRMDEIPDVQAAGDFARDLVVTNWIGIFAPAKTPAAIIERLSAALVKGVESPDMREDLIKRATVPAAYPAPAEFKKFVATEYARFGALVRERGITIN